MSNVAKKYIWSFFNSAVGRTAIVTDENDVAKAVEIYKELGYKNIDKIEFISEAYAEENGLKRQFERAQEEIERLRQIINASSFERTIEDCYLMAENERLRKELKKFEGKRTIEE
jgi:hypothetical protein